MNIFGRILNKRTCCPPELEHVILTQVSMAKGLKSYGEAGVDAVEGEMKQLHQMKSLKPRKLTREQKKQALAYLMYLKKKSTDRIKGRGCADGRKQRQHIPKNEATSPTVSTETVFISAAIDAHEGRDVAIIDIPP